MAAQRSTLWRQTNTLANKNFTLIYSRHFNTTLYAAFLLPIIWTLYLGIFQNIGNQTSEFGDAQTRVIRSLKEGLDAADSTRDTVVFVDNGFAGGDIEKVIKSLSDEVNSAGKTVSRKSNPNDMPSVCRSSFMGSTNCYGAVVFHSSPDEGDGGIWNYTLRGDFSLGGGFKYKDDNNDAQVYTLPLQLAVDSAIASLNSTKDGPDLSNSEEWPFTSETDKERKDRVRRNYQKSIINYMGVGFILAFIGVSFHLPGNMSGEREKGLSQLIDAMMPTTRDYEAQMARMLSFFYAFAAVYAPGWIIASIITRFMIWKETSVIIIIVFFLLSGLALTSQAIMGGTLFKKAQLSGQVNSIVYLLLGVLAQAIPSPGTAGVAILGLLFTPCSIIFFVISIAKYEAEGKALDLLEAPPDSDSDLPPIVLWIFMIVQLIVYPVIATFLERAIHGVAAESRTVFRGGSSQPQDAVTISGLTKVYEPSFIRRLFSFIVKPRAPTVAVNNLSFSVKHGQIVALLGANGSGKSTTLDAIAGMSRFNHGNISIDASRGIGIAPQQNVLWDELTVAEHIRLFNSLKSPFNKASGTELYELIDAIGLTQKLKARAGTLSGGQKRKLQLGMMLTGGSGVCCVDEVSSGIDPLSRRKIWDILLAERGRRTIIMTTHFLDEADLLSDDIVILSKGSLRAQGSPVVLKDTLGSGYRIHVLNAKHVRNAPDIHGVSRTLTSTNIVYTAPSSTLAAEVIRVLEASGIEYRLSTPTIEDVFLQLVDEVKSEQGLPAASGAGLENTKSEDHSLLSTPDHASLLTGKQTGFFKQVIVLIQKRYILLKSNWVPHLIAFLIPIIAAAVMQLLIRDKAAIGCSPQDQSSNENDDAFKWLFSDGVFVSGPSSDISSSLGDLLEPVLPGGYHNSSLELQDSFSSFRSYVEDNRKDVRPGGWWLGGDGESPLITYRSENQSSVMAGIAALNLLNRMRTNITVATSYIPFDIPIAEGMSSALQLAIFFAIASNLAPAFFGLYPNVERRNQVRALQYSSGVRSYSLWTAHLAFDFGIFVIPFLVAATIFAVSSDMWFSVGYLFPVFVLYALATILISYVCSLFTRSQLSTYVATMVYNSVGFAIYLISFMFILQRSSSGSVEKNITIAHYVIAFFFPAGSLFRALVVGLNVNSLACDGDVHYSYPGAMDAYGSPILYLAVQAVIMFSILLYNDSGNKLPSFLSRKKPAPSRSVQPEPHDQEGAHELTNVYADKTKEGLSVQNLTKSFGKFTAVDNVTFGVPHGQIFALLGPNGAGKSTTISLIRGDIQPSVNGGDVFIEKTSVKDQRALARSHLGVCPQFDAIEPMTVLEHLRIYTRLRGVSDVEHQVQAIIRAVGLEAFINTMAPHLSGGNKRKLSLGITLAGNPSVILLDEPSSGLDAAAKRIMWRTLESLSPGRSILLTTHSMEEADALASRAGILARHMLAIGDVETLRSRFDDSLYVHLVSQSAPHSTPEEMQNMRAWVLHLFPGAQVEPETYSGQMRFSVPAAVVLQHASSRNGYDPNNRTSAIGQLILMLEENKAALGIKHHSVSPTTLNDVFLAIVGQHSVQEEGYGPNSGGGGPSKLRKFMLGPWA